MAAETRHGGSDPLRLLARGRFSSGRFLLESERFATFADVDLPHKGKQQNFKFRSPSDFGRFGDLFCACGRNVVETFNYLTKRKTLNTYF
jgi:hypothetical protein